MGEGTGRINDGEERENKGKNKLGEQASGSLS